MRLLRFFLAYSPRTLLLAIAAGVACGACSTALVALVNESLAGRGTAAAPAAFLAIVLLLAGTRYAAEVLLTRLGQGALFELRTALSRQVLGVPLQYLESAGPHRVLATLTDDVPTITGALMAVPVVCVNLAVFLGGMCYLAWLSPTLAGVVAALLLLGVAGYQLPVFSAMGELRLAREAGGRLYEHFQSLTAGTKELKLHQRRRADFLEGTLRAAATDFRARNVRGMAMYSAAAAWGQSFVFLMLGGVAWLTLWALPVEPEVRTGFILVLLFVTSPLQVVMNQMPAIGRANVAVAKVQQMGLELSTHGERAGTAPVEAPAEFGGVSLEGVTYTYLPENDDRPFTLGPLSLTVSPGEIVYIVGGNGSGKTTLAKLLAGLYTPESGTLRLGGRAVRPEEMEEYRQHVSAVFSDFHLFENFPGLSAETMEARVQVYLERLHLAGKVRFEEGRLSTLRLSQGQRKRLALLTAYLEDRPLYLFDEWAADQDPYFRGVFYRELLPELRARGKAVIVVTHDDRYFDLADQVVRLEYGARVEDAPCAPLPL